MTVADGSQTRLADVSETVIGTIPTSPAFQVMRYVSSDIRLMKQTDTPNEIRADRNVSSIVDVGRMVNGNISTFLSYGTYDTWLERLFASSWSTNVLKNGVTHKAGTLEFTYEQGALDSYIRYAGCRWNTLDLTLNNRQSVGANWGIMGITSPDPTNAILSGATYAPATTTDVFNAGLNVAGLQLSSTSMADSPGAVVVQSMSLRMANNIYAVDALGQYYPYAHGLGRFEVTGSATILFENLQAYRAIINHEDVAIAFSLVDAAANSYAFSIPKAKFLDGGPPVPGNGQAVTMTVPFQAYYDTSSAASISITRSP